MEYDYIVIGIGGIGSAALYWLTRLAPNAKILGLEQFKLGHVRGGSQDVSRIIRKMYPGKAMTDFAGHSYAPWAEIEKESGLKLVTKCGGLYWTSEESGYMHMVEDIRDAMRASGQDVDFLRSDEIERRWPQIQFRGRKGAGILDPEAGLVDAAMANGAHQTAAVRRGATILEDARVRSVQNVPGGIEVETTRGTFTGRRVVVSSGAWVNEVLATTGNRIPVKVSQENVTYLASLHLKAFTPQNFPVFIYIDADVDLYALPVHGIPGFKIGVDAGGNETTGDNRTWTPDPVREKRVLDFVHRFMPKAEGRVIETKTCLYTMTLDRTFVVDSLATRGYPDLLVVCGAGHAFKFAALLGKIMAQLAIDGQTEYDISQFKFERPAITDPNFKPAFVMRTAKKPAAKM